MKKKRESGLFPRSESHIEAGAMTEPPKDRMMRAPLAWKRARREAKRERPEPCPHHD